MFKSEKIFKTPNKGLLEASLSGDKWPIVLWVVEKPFQSWPISSDLWPRNFKVNRKLVTEHFVGN